MLKAHLTETPRPSNRTIAERIGVSRAAIQRCLKRHLDTDTHRITPNRFSVSYKATQQHLKEHCAALNQPSWIHNIAAPNQRDQLNKINYGRAPKQIKSRC